MIYSFFSEFLFYEQMSSGSWSTCERHFSSKKSFGNTFVLFQVGTPGLPIFLSITQYIYCSCVFCELQSNNREMLIYSKVIATAAVGPSLLLNLYSPLAAQDTIHWYPHFLLNLLF